MTTASCLWLWRRGCRALATEVGLHARNGLCTPWDGRWRVDIAAVEDARIHVVEVKGTVADLTRESLDDGKWLLDYARLGLNPWLALADDIDQKHCRDLPRTWGLLHVASDGRVRALREPPPSADVDVTGTYRALAQVLTTQGLPTLFGTDIATAMALLSEHGLDRPWRRWAPNHVAVGDVDDDREEQGNIL